MHELLYCMRFKGTATPESENSATLFVEASGDSCTVTTSIDDDGMKCALQPIAGGHAYFHSRVTITRDGAFQEEGGIRFGEKGHALRFVSVGEGHMGPGAEPNMKAGAVTWRVEGGEGQFEGATGLITSNFIVMDDDVTDFQVGVIFVPNPSGS